MSECDVAVVGAGPAGLAAAGAASAAGAEVVLLDDQPLPGGQYLRHPDPVLGARGPDPFGSLDARGRALLAIAANPWVDHWSGTTVWNLPEPGTIAWASAGAAGRLRARAIVLAPGAHDQCVPFPGWTLPGVITAGGAQNLMKGQRMLPGRRVLVAGTGPLLLVTAASLLEAGAEVVAVAEAAPLASRLPGNLTGMLAAPALLALAARYRLRLLSSRVPVLRGHTIVAAQGTPRVSEAVVAPIDPDGTVHRDRARVFDVDAVVTGFGLRCSGELMRLAGCEMHPAPASGGWIPVRGESLETRVPGLFVAGDGATIGGARMAMLEGELAGLGAARRAGRAVGSPAREIALRRRLRRLARFRVALERLYAPPATFAGLRDATTLVCRCEDVSVEEIQAALAAGARSIDGVKSHTRAGMGRCQGRNCLHTVADLVAGSAGVASESLRWPRARPPARPVPIEVLLTEAMPPPDLPEDPHQPRGR